MSSRCRSISILLLVSLGFAVSAALAQINRANLNGTVTDPSGASIPNSQVEVVAPDTGFKRQTTTGSSGVYSISSLPTGTYDLTVSGNGFKTFEEKGIELSVGQTRTVNVQLVVGAPTTTVEVRASAQALDSNNAEISTVIQSRTSGGHPPERARLGHPDDARPGRGQPRRRRPEGPAIRRARHRRQQLHLRWSRCHGRPGAEPEGGRAPGHFAGIDRGVPRRVPRSIPRIRAGRPGPSSASYRRRARTRFTVRLSISCATTFSTHARPSIRTSRPSA